MRYGGNAPAYFTIKAFEFADGTTLTDTDVEARLTTERPTQPSNNGNSEEATSGSNEEGNSESNNGSETENTEETGSTTTNSNEEVTNTS